ncbi:MAG: amidohydrolase [Acidobacteriales bacterium]|nr:amidohydrolase [Terriglobales bacterium]
MFDWRLDLRNCLEAAFLIAACAGIGHSADTPADIVIVNARVYTLSSKQPWAEAVAIRGNRIAFVGRDRVARKFTGKNTKVVDAQKRLVLPGITDSHIHFMDGSLSLGRVNLDETRNVEDIQRVLQEYVAAHPATNDHNAWVLGRGWSYPSFPEALPHKKYIDPIIPDRPAFIEGFDGHTYWANSKALELAGITRDTPDPPNGHIVRESSGELTGALKEAAADLVQRILPKITREERLTALRAGIAAANRAGLTRVHSCGGDFEYLDLYDELRKKGQLTVRFYMGYFLNPPELTEADIAKIEEASRRFPATDTWISGGAVKMMLDGVVETHTAAMLNPYADDPTQTGKLFWEPAKYKQAVAELDRRGFQLFTHAIGERAVRLALDAYQDGTKRYSRPRIEHIETITAQDIPRFGKLGVIASFQPLHSYPDDDTLKVWLRNAGPEREPRSWAWQDVARSGGKMAFGSDWPVVTLNPWAGIQNAVTRQTREGQPPGGWLPQQRLSIAQAVYGYTLGAAIGGRREKDEGSIEPGKLADLIMVSQNIFEIDPHKIADTQVILTILDGKTVYDAASTPTSTGAQEQP